MDAVRIPIGPLSHVTTEKTEAAVTILSGLVLTYLFLRMTYGENTGRIRAECRTETGDLPVCVVRVREKESPPMATAMLDSMEYQGNRGRGEMTDGPFGVPSLVWADGRWEMPPSLG